MQTKNITIVRKNVKNFSLKVRPNGRVELVLPLMAKNGDINFILEKYSKWIDDKKAYFKEFETTKKELVSGESMKFLGKDYRLRVIKDSKEMVEFDKFFINLYAKNVENFSKKSEILEKWYRENALIYFLNIANEYNKIIKIDDIKIKIRKMKTRWGSCNASKKSINLNLELIKKPKICIEYVIFHELAHLIHPNHSKEFYNFLSLHMSDWKNREKILNRVNF